MGGKAFGRQATRMTTSQSLRLQALCFKGLQGFFHKILPLRHYTHKETHGDIDILCAWQGIKLGQFTRQIDCGNVDTATQEVNRDWSEVTCDSGKDVFAEWCEAVAAGIGGIRWTRFNYETPVLSIMAPCRIFDSDINSEIAASVVSGSSVGEDDFPFYQVDLLLLPPESQQLAFFLASGGSAITLLFAALRALSPSLTVQATFLSICHSPYRSIPPVRIMLTTSLEEVLAWLGLDLAVWHRGFQNEEAFRRWISKPSTGGVLQEAWNRIISGQTTTPGQGRRRKETWEGFKGWLDDVSLLEAYQNGTADLAFRRTAARRGISTNHHHALRATSDSTGDMTQWIKAGQDHSGLDFYATSALTRWGKLEEFKQGMKIAQQAASTLSSAHHRRSKNRAEATSRKAEVIQVNGEDIIVNLPR